MAQFIILTAEQAAHCSGETAPGHELQPIALADGETFVLGAEVLSDPAHAEMLSFLSSLPTREILPNEWATQ